MLDVHPTAYRPDALPGYAWLQFSDRVREVRRELLEFWYEPPGCALIDEELALLRRLAAADEPIMFQAEGRSVPAYLAFDHQVDVLRDLRKAGWIGLQVWPAEQGQRGYARRRFTAAQDHVSASGREALEVARGRIPRHRSRTGDDTCVRRPRVDGAPGAGQEPRRADSQRGDGAPPPERAEQPLRRAQEEEVVPPGFNPVAALMEKPSARRLEARWLEVPDAALFLEAARTLPPRSSELRADLVHPLLATFLLTGGRRAEVLGLEVTDVSFPRGTVTFRPNCFRRLKTATSARVVPLWPQLRDVLHAYLNVRTAAMVLHDAPACALLFPSFRTGQAGQLMEGAEDPSIGWPCARGGRRGTFGAGHSGTPTAPRGSRRWTRGHR